MTTKTTICSTLIFFWAFSPSSAQTTREATAAGAKIVGGGLAFSSSGGDLYGGDDRLNIIELIPSVRFFATGGIGIGADASLSYLSSGNFSTTNISVGPAVGYYHESSSGTIPFIAASASVVRIGDGDDAETGFRFKAGPGFIVRKGHLGLSVDASYILDRFKFEGADSATTGNMIAVTVGLTGLLY